jgi:hypothetical protein
VLSDQALYWATSREALEGGMNQGGLQIALLPRSDATGRNSGGPCRAPALLEDLGSRARYAYRERTRFSASSGPLGRELEALLEREIAARSTHLDVMVRDQDAWSAMMAQNPFPEDAALRPNRLLATALKGVPDEDGARAFEALVAAPDKARVIATPPGSCSPARTASASSRRRPTGGRWASAAPGATGTRW